MKYCNCMRINTMQEGLTHIRDEALEFIREPSMDEFSDTMYAIGRLVGSIVNKRYVRMPFDSLHVDKMNKRMTEYGCIRSRRHLINGQCPSR